MTARRTFSAQDKIGILRLHLLQKRPISEICARHMLNPTIFYRWKTQLFKHGAAAFETTHHDMARRGHDAPLRKPARQPEEQVVHAWMLKLMQGKIHRADFRDFSSESFDAEYLPQLLKSAIDGPLRYRSRAVCVLSFLKGIPLITISRFLLKPRSTIYNWVRTFQTSGCGPLFCPTRREPNKHADRTYVDAVFATLHAPPESHGVNRTTWRQKDIQAVLRKKSLTISRACIGRIVKDAGYRYRKAKRVLTSTDPDYHAKLEAITSILSHLGPNEKFFSIDEFGPFAVRAQGGKALVKRGHIRTVPQYQKSKGSLIITGALELSTNQMTHFYSKKKDTQEMIRLLDLLVRTYASQGTIYLSWDAGFWHMSKALYERVDEINQSGRGTPHVRLVPLPASAQFLNVIESVFSGMARAILHNSDYTSVEECMRAIDLHFAERNQYFRENPRRAGGKIWGRERVAAEFRESNNCKDPRYQSR